MIENLKGAAILFAVLSMTSFSAKAQTKFEAGYFVDREGSRTECLIRNEDWLRSPRSIRYKTRPDSDPVTLNINDLTEFGVAGARYVCSQVKVDTSSQDPKHYTTIREALWDNRYVAMKLLVDGKGKLYHYDDKKVSLFFYSVDSSPIEQLEYKSYLVASPSQADYRVGQNINYINQLGTYVSCGDVFTRYGTNKFRYTADFLSNYFRQYNKCSGDDVATDAVKQKREKIHLRLTPGVNLGSARIRPTLSAGGKFSDNELAFRFGADTEIVLPFKNNKWRIFLEPTYQSFKTDTPIGVNYSSVELPVGVRHYFFLSEDFTIFVNGAIVFDFIINLDAQLTVAYQQSFTKTRDVSSALGAGVGYKRFNFETRYYFPRYSFSENGAYECTYKQLTFIVGYRLF